MSDEWGIAGIDTLEASKALLKWVYADMLIPDTSKGKSTALGEFAYECRL